MKYSLVRADDLHATTWSGGTTTELAIFPPGASYASRDFQWRLSTAVVTASESTFTSLPGYHRLLMVLSGEMHLKHAGQHQATLRPFEQDSFSGGWTTHCAGTGRDFNLMLGAGWRGSLQAIRMDEDGAISLEPAASDATEAFYCVSGQARIVLPGELRLLLGTGDFMILQQGLCNSRLRVSSHAEPTDLVRARIWPE